MEGETYFKGLLCATLQINSNKLALSNVTLVLFNVSIQM